MEPDQMPFTRKPMNEKRAERAETGKAETKRTATEKAVTERTGTKRAVMGKAGGKERVYIPRVMIAGTASGCGKTTIVCAVLAALRKRNTVLAAFKCGPDFIDPMFHTKILGIPSRNLDPYFMDREMLQYLLVKNSMAAWRKSSVVGWKVGMPFGKDEMPGGADSISGEQLYPAMTVIEGVMGYYDGLGMQDEASSHDLAVKTQTPVILVVDARGRSRSAEAELKGFAEFSDPSMIRGVIFNQAAPSLVPSLNEYATSIGLLPLGYLPKVKGAEFPGRHLGLITAEEIRDLQRRISLLAETAEQTLDLDGICRLAEMAPQLPCTIPESLAQLQDGAKALQLSCTVPENPSHRQKSMKTPRLRIGIARDRAFCFYYEDNLDLLREMGCEIVPFSPVSDKQLPEDLSGLYLGGGYPELHGKELSSNYAMLESVRTAIGNGMPALAECGGFMYLHSSLQSPDGSRWKMAGVIHGNVSFTAKLQHFGYVEMQAIRDTFLCRKGERIRAHEFHRSISDAQQDVFLERKGGRAWTGFVLQDNLLAGWPHLHFMADPVLALNFVQKCRDYRAQRISGAGWPGTGIRAQQIYRRANDGD